MISANPKYPNLELIEHKFWNQLYQDNDFKQKLYKLKNKNTHIKTDFDAVVFSQIWGSTCTAFDMCEDGSPAFGGQVLTKAYTTVIKEVLTETYGVFIGNEPCYIVTNPTDEFYTDLAERHMASFSEAKERY